MSLLVEGARARTSRVLDKVSPTRVIFGNVRGIRLRDLPKDLLRKVLYHKEPSTIPARKSGRDIILVDGNRFYVPSFAKKDFSKGIKGSTGFDLTSAFITGQVTTGDLIRDLGRKVDVVYIEPADLDHGGRLGFHKALRAGEDAGRNIFFVGGDRFPWEKTGQIGREELLSRLDRSLSSTKEPRY